MEESDGEPGETEPLVSPQTAESNPDAQGRSCKREPLLQQQSTPKRESKVAKSGGQGVKKDARTKTGRDTLNPNLHALEEASDEDEEGIKLMKSNEEEERDEASSSSLFCPLFGVRNYLHQFYEKDEIQNPHLYEEMPTLSDGRESVFLVKRKEGICSSSVFRLSLLLGGLILLMGTTAFIVAASASRRATLVGKVGGVDVVDRVAAAHNAEVDALFLVGLVALTLGATVVASALISRAFCTIPDPEDSFREGLLPGYASIYEHPPFLQPTDKKVPATEEVTQIQPWISASHVCP